MSKKVMKFEIGNAEEILKSYAQWRDMTAEKRKDLIAKAGNYDNRIKLDVQNPVKDGIRSVSFYSSGKVYLTFGKFHSIKLESGFDPQNRYTSKDGVTKAYPLTWSEAKDYYSIENKKLVAAISKGMA